MQLDLAQLAKTQTALRASLRRQHGGSSDIPTDRLVFSPRLVRSLGHDQPVRMAIPPEAYRQEVEQRLIDADAKRRRRFFVRNFLSYSSAACSARRARFAAT